MGMSCVEWTIHCFECADLIDVLVSEEPWNTAANWTVHFGCPHVGVSEPERDLDRQTFPNCRQFPATHVRSPSAINAFAEATASSASAEYW